jgi:hypothetical protein
VPVISDASHPHLAIGMLDSGQMHKFLVLLLLAISVPCLPQTGIRNVTGIVTDKRGNTLPGAVVQLENTVTLTVMSCITG